jgi:hypothetical protein
MQVKVFGPMAGPGPNGAMMSWAPNQIVDVDDSNIGFYENFVAAGVAEVVDEEEDTAAPTEVEPDTLTEPESVPITESQNDSVEGDLETLRVEYEDLTGEPADKRFGVDRLRLEIEAERQAREE